MLTQATKVFCAEESGQWIGRFSYITLWMSLKKSRAKPLTETAAVRVDGPAVIHPRLVKLRGSGMAEAVATILTIEGAIEEEDARR